MDIKTTDNAAIIESIQKTNDLLKMMAAAKLNIDEKMIKADVTEAVAEGIGEKVDVSA
jgi:hypothetical protein